MGSIACTSLSIMSALEHSPRAWSITLTVSGVANMAGGRTDAAPMYTQADVQRERMIHQRARDHHLALSRARTPRAPKCPC